MQVFLALGQVLFVPINIWCVSG